MVLPVNFLNVEHFGTLSPGFPFPTLSFLFFEMNSLMCCFPATQWMGCALSSTGHRALGSHLCLPAGDEVPGRGKMFLNMETSSWAGVSVPTLPLLVPT